MSNLILEGILVTLPNRSHSGRIYDKNVFDIEYQKLLRSLLLKDRIIKINKLKDRINGYQR